MYHALHVLLENSVTGGGVVSWFLGIKGYNVFEGVTS